jgi:hypothetical protein
MRPSVMHAAAVMTRALWVRFHVTVILLGVVVVGMLANTLLLHLGLGSLPLRYALDVLIGYAAFFVGVKLWLRYAETALPPRLKHEVVQIEDGAPPAAPADGSPRSRWWDFLPIEVPDVSDGAGCLVAALLLLALLALLVLLGVGVYLVAEAPTLLGEVFVQAALAGALRRRVKRMDEPHWSGTVLRATFIPAGIVLLLALLLGVVLHLLCPTAARLLEALVHCPS